MILTVSPKYVTSLLLLICPLSLRTIKDSVSSLDTEISDYGLSDFRNRIIESFITDINFTLKNRTLGEYEDFCVRVAILDDKEFEVLREPKMSDCSPGSMDSYKKRLDFQSL